MKIWLDLRFINDNLYSKFILELVKELIVQKNNDSFIIYSNKVLEWFKLPNVKNEIINIPNKSIKEQTAFFRILKKEKTNLMIFFNIFKPIFYVWNYIIVIPSLKEVYYSNFKNHFDKYTYLYLLEKNLKRSEKIICFDKNTIEELIEKFNIPEKKTNIITWFFPCWSDYEKIENLNINIKTKYNLQNDFLLYSGWEWVEKNYDKLVHIFKKLKDNWENIDLVFLWDTISRNIVLRNLILSLNMQKNIHFLWIIKPAEKILFYKNSIWVIFPSFYEPFPFNLTEPIFFKTPIIASDLINIKSIFNDKIEYISPISLNNIYEKIKNFIKINKKISEIDYKEITDKYSKENTTKKLIEIIK
jgi:glycosyltransferase involved in cell wall biosynthesis